MRKLVLLRHGESLWNKENRFTGWTDVALSTTGEEEAFKAGEVLMSEGFTFDIAYTSVLKRAIKTLWNSLEAMNLMWIPVVRSWKLNERHYGDLQGLNKAETAKQFGDDQVLVWRRSYDVQPNSLTEEDKRYPGHESKYDNLSKEELPVTECLKDTVQRVIPYWREVIVPELKKGRKVLIVAHGNSLRALVKFLDNISDSDIVSLNIPTGMPLVYELDDNLKPLNKYYLGDPEEVKKAMEEIANQGKAK